MAYPLTGSTLTATGGTVIRTPAVADVTSASATRTLLPLAQVGSLFVVPRSAVVTVAQPLQPPAVGQMWPRGGRSNTG